MYKFLISLALFIVTFAVQAAPVDIVGLRLWEGPDGTRVVFDLSGPVDHSVFSLENPHRVVIDLDDARMNSTVPSPGADGRIDRIRHAPRDENDLRVVLDLAEELKPRSFLVKPNGEYGHRLVLDLQEAAAGAVPEPVKRADSRAAVAARELVVAIDAGHGGEDPGALGRAGTREKDVALQIARDLATKVDAEPGMRAILIRDGDYYIPHRERREKARRASADLFISVHADAFPDARARGASVYALSQGRASSEAALILAKRENAADLVGGVSLADKDDVLRSVLVDLSQTATLNASLNVGHEIVSEMKRVAHMHKTSVQQAPFAVLTSPDVPSILVETAFISNPDEERKLRDRGYQRRLAAAVVDGIRGYFHANPPPGTLIAAWQGRGGADPRQHAVRRGDTLSGIARQYKVSLQTLRAVNGKSDDVLRVGEKLVIPLGS